MSRRSIPSLLIALSLAPAAAAQIEHIEYFKSGVYTQTSNNAPVVADFWSLSGRVITTFASDLTTAEIGAPDLEFSEPMIQYDATWLWYSPGFATREDLEAAFPDGIVYQFNVDGPAGSDLADVFSADSLFVADIPAFTGSTFDDLQEMNPNLSFGVQVNGFQPVAGANDSAVFLDLIDTDNNNYIFITFTSPDTTWIEIPAGTLLPDTNYEARLFYSSRLVTFDAYFGVADTAAAYDLVTELNFHTRACIADLDGLPGVDLSDFFFFLNCFDATDPCADIDGAPGVDLGDFFAFFNAFDQSC